MRKVFSIAIFLVALGGAGAAQTVIPENVSPAAREVFAAIRDWADAVRSGDATALDRIFEDELIVTTADGKTRGKSAEIELLKPRPNVKAVSISNDDVKVRIFGDSALATGLVRMHIRIDERESHTAFRYTTMFVRKDGRWQIVGLHANAPKPRDAPK
jgi:ketosteroid isomerase-like protein